MLGAQPGPIGRQVLDRGLLGPREPQLLADGDHVLEERDVRWLSAPGPPGLALRGLLPAGASRADSASRSEAACRTWLACLLRGERLPGLAVSRQPFSQALDGVGLGKQVFGDDQLGDLAIELGDGLGRAFPGRAGGFAERVPPVGSSETHREQQELAKLGQRLLAPRRRESSGNASFCRSRRRFSAWMAARRLNDLRRAARLAPGLSCSPLGAENEASRLRSLAFLSSIR